MTDNQLPLFESNHPDRLDVKVSGSVEFDAVIGTPAGLDHTVFLVVETTVGSVGHHRDADGKLHRSQNLKILALEVLAGSDGVRLLAETHKRAREAAGIHELPLEENVDLDTGEFVSPDEAMEKLERAFESQSSRS